MKNFKKISPAIGKWVSNNGDVNFVMKIPDHYPDHYGYKSSTSCGTITYGFWDKYQKTIHAGMTPIQVAATAALNGPEDCISEIRSVYKKRRDILISSFKRAGWSLPLPDATMFAWAPIPEKYSNKGSLYFSKILLKKAGVAVSPGIGFGKYGDKHVRISLVENEHRIRQAARNIKNNIKL